METPFSLPEFAKHLSLDGGYDMHAISQEELAALIQDRFEGDWDEPRFSFNEIIGHYDGCRLDGGLVPIQVPLWAASVMILGEVVRRGHSGWGNLIMVLEQMIAFQADLTLEDCVRIVGEAFRP